ncbi:MAG: putative DNA-binding transcriptional regulator YafY [Bradymonadia bacterium]|jgi:predicted DNA-binding transcriptional regulator YafY
MTLALPELKWHSSVTIPFPSCMNKTERLFAIAEHLRTRRSGVTAESLAERFDVSVRTMYRDLDALRAAHLPVNADPGPGGGYALDHGYALPPLHFTAREAAVLTATLSWLRDHRLVPFAHTLDDARAKLRAALPAAQQARADRLASTLSFLGVPALPVDEETRRAVEQAWIEDSPMRFVYNGVRGQTHRRARIRSVVVDRAETLLNCTDLERNVPRQFHLHRMSEVVVGV